MKEAKLKGWIKFHRKMLNWEWYDHPNVWRVFTHCIFKANYCDTRWHGQPVKRGNFITSSNKLAEETRLSRQQVRTALKKLTSTNEITIEANTQFTKITVNNYDKYQTSTSEATNEQPASNQRLTTSKEDKEEKKEYKEKINNKKDSEEQNGEGTAQDLTNIPYRQWLAIKRKEHRPANRAEGLSHPSSKFLDSLYELVDEGGYGLTKQDIADAQKFFGYSKPEVMWLLETHPKIDKDYLLKRLKEERDNGS